VSPPGDRVTPVGGGPGDPTLVGLRCLREADVLGRGAAEGTPAQLAGFSLVITSDRRAQELANSFTRRGAEVLLAPVMRILPLARDEQLLAAIRKVIADPPQDVVVTTAIGFRGWIEAADAAGLAHDLHDTLARARILVRGPRVRRAVRAAGLTEDYMAPTETSGEVVEYLVGLGVTGRRVVVQLHGCTNRRLLDRLREAGATVGTVPVYRWGPSPDPVAVRRAIDAVCAHTADAVVFTSAPGSEAFLTAARTAGRYAEVVRALHQHVLPAAVGDVTAHPLRAAGLDPLVPERFRLGALVRVASAHLADHCIVELSTAAGVLTMRGQRASLDGVPLALTPTPMSVLRELARSPGEIVDRHRLLAALPGAGDMHAVEVAVGRLRSKVGRRGLVETVVRRGYRLALA